MIEVIRNWLNNSMIDFGVRKLWLADIAHVRDLWKAESHLWMLLFRNCRLFVVQVFMSVNGRNCSFALGTNKWNDYLWLRLVKATWTRIIVQWSIFCSGCHALPIVSIELPRLWSSLCAGHHLGSGRHRAGYWRHCPGALTCSISLPSLVFVVDSECPTVASLLFHCVLYQFSQLVSSHIIVRRWSEVVQLTLIPDGIVSVAF